MWARLKPVEVPAVCGVLGAIVGGVIALTYFEYAYRPLAQIQYIAIASRAKLDVRLLELARAGDSDRVVAVLEGQLDSELSRLDFLQQQAPEHFRKVDVDADLSRVREYRATHPSPSTDPDVAASIGRALSRAP
jgi:hypothetical protein